MTLAYSAPSPPPLAPPLAAAAMPPSATRNPPGEALPARFKRTCPECGAPHLAAKRAMQFCSAACRKAFNNRRLTRGAEIYDLWMALRCDRKRANPMGVWKLLCRLSQYYREDDERERAGRKSWRDPAHIIAEKPYLRADRLGTFRWNRGPLVR